MQITSIPNPYIFQLQQDWLDSTPVWRLIREQDFYISTEAPQFGLNLCPKAMREELSIYSRVSSFPEGGALDNCFHSALQQAVIQNPHVYLAALASMGSLNPRVVSLPVAPLIVPPGDNSVLMDALFPFGKFLANERAVPATRVLYALGGANVRIAENSRHKEQVKVWWEACQGDFELAEHVLDLDSFTTANLEAGEFVVFPPQQPYYIESPSSTSSGRQTEEQTIILEVRYISIDEENNLDFSYWPEGNYDEISRFNRDLLGPTVTGWGAASQSKLSGRRFATGIEIRGVWNIGDAILGLTSWSSPLVQMELAQLFEAPEGEWFNKKFVDEVQDRFDKKLECIMGSLQMVCDRVSGNSM